MTPASSLLLPPPCSPASLRRKRQRETNFETNMQYHQSHQTRTFLATLRHRQSLSWVLSCRDLLKTVHQPLALPLDFWHIPTTGLHLRLLGFCGIDDSVNLLELIDISRRFPFVEWGVLLCNDERMGTPRHASDAMLEALRQCNYPLQLAGHLCGTRALEVLNGDFTFVQHLIQCGFQRVQVNVASAGVPVEMEESYMPSLRKAMLATPELEWIIQTSTPPTTAGIPPLPPAAAAAAAARSALFQKLSKCDPPPNMSVLHDSSMGLGIEIVHFPAPYSMHVVPKGCGYAGGIGPGNITSVLRAVQQAAQGQPVWVDMESSLRTIVEEGRDVFDLRKVLACIECAVAVMAGEL